MNPDPLSTFTAFQGKQQIASGSWHAVTRVQAQYSRGEPAPILVFNDITGNVVDIDPRVAQAQSSLQGKEAGICAAPEIEPTLPEGGARGPGRPKLGVVAREVTLLPRHWEWLASQPGGASVALRKLVEHARRANTEQDRRRLGQEAAYRFMSTMAGNEPGFEEAIRALFAGDQERFAMYVALWPADVGDYAQKLAGRAFERIAVELP